MVKTTKPTVAVVCYNEGKNIADCLNSLLNQSCGIKKYEILVIDNNSSDQTQKIIQNFQRKNKNLRLVINPERNIALSRNLAVKNTKTDLLAFTDADCVVPRKWLATLVRDYLFIKKKDDKVVAVGGSTKPPLNTPFLRALGIVLNSLLGSGRSIQGRIYPKNKYVPHLPCVNVLYEKEKIEEVGGFNESFGSIIEDEDLTWRLSKKGYRFFYLASGGIVHKWVNNFPSWAGKMFIWGKGRAWFLKKYPERLQLIFLGPIGLTFTLILLPFFPFLLYPILLYFLVVLFFSSRGALKLKDPSLITYVFTLYFTTHLFYGLGEIYGLFKRRS